MPGEVEGRSVLLAAGTDARGLVYALTELTDRVQCLPTWRSAFEFAEPAVERPASRIRSIIRGFNSEVEEKVWFYDRDFWRSDLTTLVASRVNRFSFTTGMGYNSATGITDGYLTFPYPFLVKLPGYDVRAKGLPEEERARNLATLQFIGEECARRGLDFQLGVWTLAHAWTNSPKATYVTEGLTDATHATYLPRCAGGFAAGSSRHHRRHLPRSQRERDSQRTGELLEDPVRRHCGVRPPRRNRHARQKHGTGDAGVRTGHQPAHGRFAEVLRASM